ncbi:VolA/Pla-1 family phospholipase [Rheinheimera sp. WS51]|uniref:VolA/Pla-1 family phospholipase n=1 Tax=Rheinheimera sp. WS51 TaxID=3425886 RepID=UPI003D8D7191
MNKLALGVAVAVALGLTACGDSLQDIKDDAQDNPIVPLSRVVFDPGASVPRLSVPNDLLFQGTQDGTLTLDAGESPDYTNPQVALGALDGWSTQNPFAIAIDFSAGVSLDATSASRPDAVRIFEVLMGDPASSDESCREVPRGFACKAVSQLTFGQDFVTAAKGNSVAVIPLKPLKPKTSYLVVLTSVLADSEGNAIAPSTSYELVKQDFATKPLSSESQRNLQRLINSFENSVAQEGIDKETIIYTAAITTQSAGEVLSSIKGLMAPSPLNNNTPPVLMAADTGMLVSDLLFPGAEIADTPEDPRFMFKLARYYSGTIDLPYYLGEPTESNPTAPLNTRWLARCDSGAIIAALPDSMKPATPVSANDAYCQGASNGALRDLTQYNEDGEIISQLDKARHLTKFNTIPKTNAMQTLAVQVTIPNSDYGLTMPETGWPVVILQHGIRSKKEDMLAVTGTLSSQGFATVAIDHPLHGSRGYTVEVPLADGGTRTVVMNASTNSATDYMNLSNLLVTRDNLRQSIADMLGLRLGLNFAQGVQFDMSKVQFLGHSLGAITGSSMVALANTTTGKPELDALYKINTAALAMPGGAIANFLLDSPSFGPLIKASIMLGAGGETAQNYIKFATEINSGCGAPMVPPFAACYPPFVEYLQQTGNTAALTALDNAFSQFAFAAQTVTDAGDPNNYAQRLVASNTPSYLIEVVGDGGDNLADQVVPNGFANPLAALQAGKMPLAGTEPLARLLGAGNLPAAEGAVALQGQNAIARFSAGSHSSILSPEASPAATKEMQTQMASFFYTGGEAVLISDISVIAPAN